MRLPRALPAVILASAAALGLNAACAKSVAQACADLATAVCTKHNMCSNGVNISTAYGDYNTCVLREELNCNAAAAAPQTGNSVSAIEGCVAAYPGFSCLDYFSNNPPQACVRGGGKQAGQACAFNSQCASAYCNDSKTSACGTCGAAPALGSSCSASECARGQRCLQHSSVCQSQSEIGDPCDNTTQPCGAGLSCVGSTASAMGSCAVAVSSAGANCGGTLPGCDASIGLSCAGPAGQRSCAAISIAGDGEACGALGAGAVARCSDGACYGQSGLAGPGEAGTCRADAADGGACDTVNGPGCTFPARCVPNAGGTSGMCTMPSGSTCG